MKPSFIEQQESRGAYFDAIREAHGKLAQDAAALAELIGEAHRYALETADAATRVPGSRWNADTVAEREFTSELACTIRIPERSAETLVAESAALTGEFPGTMAALRAGQISYRHAQVLMGQAWSLPDDARAAFEEALLKSAVNLTAAKLKRKARILRERLHPETITARHQKSVSERNVFFEPEADGMASLHWYDSAEKVQAAYDRITLMSLSLQHPDEDRTLGRLRADVFKDLILDGVTPAGLGKGIRGRVHVTVPVLTLMGRSEEPGHLEGYGPIDPDTARKIAARAPSFTRILVHPETGVVLSVGRTRYKVPKDLRRYLEVRDETCRFPGCNRAAAHSDLDHALDWQFDGLTAHDNLAHLCPGEHALKSETRWSYDIRPDGTLYWTSPTGRHFTSEPATIIQPPSPPEPPPEPPPQSEATPAPADESDETPPF